MPTVSFASYIAMMAATFTSIIESVGDYYACARIVTVAVGVGQYGTSINSRYRGKMFWYIDQNHMEYLYNIVAV
jgi:hypothetical protein